MNHMQPNRLHNALQKLTEAILEVENEVAAMKADHDPHLGLAPALPKRSRHDGRQAP